MIVIEMLVGIITKAFSLSPIWKGGLKEFQKAFELIEECIELPNEGSYKGFKASVMGHLNKGDEAKKALNE